MAFIGHLEIAALAGPMLFAERRHGMESSFLYDVQHCLTARFHHPPSEHWSKQWPPLARALEQLLAPAKLNHALVRRKATRTRTFLSLHPGFFTTPKQIPRNHDLPGGDKILFKGGYLTSPPYIEFDRVES